MMGQYGTGVRRASPSGATILLLPVSVRQDGGARVTLRHEDVLNISRRRARWKCRANKAEVTRGRVRKFRWGRNVGAQSAADR